MTDTAYVWVWLPDATEPVVAGRLDDDGRATATFTYGRSYLALSEAVPLYLPELPLRSGPQRPPSGRIQGCLLDGGPDAWGRRVIEHRRSAERADLTDIGYLLRSGSDRVGALDYQLSPDRYEPRGGNGARLDDLANAADLVEKGEPVPSELHEALLHGSSIGGARPKARVTDPDGSWIAKFSSTTDSYPVVQAEYVAMELARRVGLDVADVRIAEAFGRRVLLVRRFDRGDPGTRHMVVSSLTILELHDADGLAGRYATYPDLADQIRARFTDSSATLREIFARISFNILVGNHDDHARNHGAFWNPHFESLTLTPAYDICPQVRNVGEVAQAMAYGSEGERTSQLAPLAANSGIYHLDTDEARAITETQIDVIRDNWDEVCDLAELTAIERERLNGRQFLNGYAFYDW